MNADEGENVKCHNRLSVDEIVILSSDEESEEDVQGLLSAFVTSIERYVDKEVVVLLLTKFDEASKAFVTSPAFKQMLKRSANAVTRENAFIYTGKICHKLIQNRASERLQAYSSKVSKPETKQVAETNTNSKLKCEEASTVAGSFENNNTNSSDRPESQEIGESREVNSDSDDFVEIVCVHVNTKKKKQSMFGDGKRAQPRSDRLADKPKPKTKKPRLAKLETASGDGKHKDKFPGSPKKRRKMVKILEQKLKHIDERIKILNQAELSLEEMEFCDSTYIQESRLKEKFNRIWNKICRLQGRPPETGRVVEKSIKCKPTGYRQIDEAVQEFLNNTTGFPDVFDIRNVITRTTKEYNLKIPPQMQQELIEEVFTDIGNKLQKRRKKDYEFNFGCELTDLCLSSKDPAMHDLPLRQKLERNKKRGNRALNKVFEKFVHIDREKKLNNASYSDSSVSDSGKKSKTKKHKSNKVRESESSSGGSDLDCQHESHSEDEQNMRENDDFEVELNESQDITEPGTSKRQSSKYLDTYKDTEDNCTLEFDSDKELLSDLSISLGQCPSRKVQHVNGQENVAVKENQIELISTEKTEPVSLTCNKVDSSISESRSTTEVKDKKVKNLAKIVNALKGQSELEIASDLGCKDSSDDNVHIQNSSVDQQEPQKNSKNRISSPTVSDKLDPTSKLDKTAKGIPVVATVSLTKLPNNDFKTKGSPQKTPDKIVNSVLKPVAVKSAISIVTSTATSCKRPASPGTLPYESPLKVFRSRSQDNSTSVAKSSQDSKDPIDVTPVRNGHTDTSACIAFSSQGTVDKPEKVAFCSTRNTELIAKLTKKNQVESVSVDVIVID